MNGWVEIYIVIISYAISSIIFSLLSDYIILFNSRGGWIKRNGISEHSPNIYCPTHQISWWYKSNDPILEKFHYVQLEFMWKPQIARPLLVQYIIQYRYDHTILLNRINWLFPWLYLSPTHSLYLSILLKAPKYENPDVIGSFMSSWILLLLTWSSHLPSLIPHCPLPALSALVKSICHLCRFCCWKSGQQLPKLPLILPLVSLVTAGLHHFLPPVVSIESGW